MSERHDSATGTAIISGALMAGLAMAMLDMTIDNLPLIVVLLFASGFAFGLVAPRRALIAGFCIGIMLPIAHVYVTSFELRLPHPMHGFYFGVLGVAPPVLSAVVARWLREWFDTAQHRRRRAARSAAKENGHPDLDAEREVTHASVGAHPRV